MYNIYKEVIKIIVVITIIILIIIILIIIIIIHAIHFLVKDEVRSYMIRGHDLGPEVPL